MRRRRSLILSILILAACSKSEMPATDSPATAAPAEEAPLTGAAIGGTWEAEGMPMNQDTVVVRFTMNNTDTGEGTSMVFPSGEKVISTSRQIAGDSMVSESGAFKSQVRTGQQVTSTRMVLRLKDGRLTGIATSRYANGDTASFRITATKKP
ncbi:MAG: hypothetical protein WD801_16535 [Gemmatimonadaceae bacterium]